MISMKKITSNQTADFVAIALANLFNLIMVVIFVLCTMQAGHLLFVGIIWVVFIVALASIAQTYAGLGHTWTPQKEEDR